MKYKQRDDTTKSNNNFETFKEDFLAGIKAGKPLSGKDGLLTPLIKELLEKALEGEIEGHLAAEPEDIANRRNGYTDKTMNTADGSFELSTPRDRAGTFEPTIVKKRQTTLTDELDQKILALYALGNSYTDISKHITDLYGIEVSTATISTITDKLIPIITEWRSRPLDKIYPIMFLDGMYFKVRDNGKVITKVLYNILGVNQEGMREILGFYLADSEGANFWLGVLNDLKHRGVEDVLIVCVDGLNGFPEAINTIFPKAEVQLCVVHQIRNTLKYVVSKEQKEFMQDLKLVYKAATIDLAESNLLKLDEKWGKRYPAAIKSWRNNWNNLSQYFKYSAEIRRLIYTTNPIEGYHRQVRKYTKTKAAFSSENALFKLVYCACQQIHKKWTMPMANWGLIASQLAIHFEGRFNLI
jgi:transposase-like protein